MKILFTTATILLSGCSTTIKEHGQVVFHTQANLTNVNFSTPAGTHFHADKVDHSTPTRAGGSVIGTTGTAVTGAATAILLQ